MLTLSGCRHDSYDAHDGWGQRQATLTFVIESSPNNLDLRQGTDAQSERVGATIYDALVRKDESFNLQPWLAASWERPDALTWVFHVRPNVRFHDGKPLTADDVAWSMRSMTDGTLVTAKGGNFASVDHVEVRDPLTVVVRMKRADNSLLFNLSDGLFGVVERGAGRDEGQHPIGTGPYKFVSQSQDKDVVVERNPGYWAGPPHIQRIRFAVSPRHHHHCAGAKKRAPATSSPTSSPSTWCTPSARCRISEPKARPEPSSSTRTSTSLTPRSPTSASARPSPAPMDKQAIIQALWRGEAREADTLLPPGHWARAADADLPQYPRDIPRAVALLEAAGKHADAHGIRLRFTLKTSTDETTRLEAQVLQQQLRDARHRAHHPLHRVRHLLLRHHQRRVPDVHPPLDRLQ